MSRDQRLLSSLLGWVERCLLPVVLTAAQLPLAVRDPTPTITVVPSRVMGLGCDVSRACPGVLT